MGEMSRTSTGDGLMPDHFSGRSTGCQSSIDWHTLTFKTMSSSTTVWDLIQTAVLVRPLQSSDAPLLTVPRMQSEFAAGHFWSRLPSDIRSCSTVDNFEQYLKIHLFIQSSPDATSISVSSDLMALYKCYYYYYYYSGHHQEKNGKLCMTVGPVTRTAGILA